MRLLKIVIIIMLIYNYIFSQTVKRCEIVDTSSQNYSSSSDQYIGYSNINNILIIGYNETTKNGINYKEMFLTRYKNRGLSKEKILIPRLSENYNWSSISYPDSNHIFISADTIQYLGYFNYNYYFKYFSAILISSNNGKTWKKIFLDSNQNCDNIFMTDSLSGYLLLSNCDNFFNPTLKYGFTLLKTDNAWNTYKKLSLPDQFTGKIFYYDKQKFIILCQEENTDIPYIKITTDGGDTWKDSYFDKFTTIHNIKIYEKVIYLTAHLSYEQRYSFKIPKFYRSTDNGVTWRDLSVNLKGEVDPYIYNDIAWFDENNAIAYGVTAVYRKQFLKTTDGGNTWTPEYLPYRDSIVKLTHGVDITELIYPEKDFFFATSWNYPNMNLVMKWDKEKGLKTPQFNSLLKYHYRSLKDFTLSWDAIVGAEKYRLIVKEDTNKAPVDLTNIVVDTLLDGTNFILTNLKHNRSYWAWVKALGNDSESELSGIFFTTIYDDSTIEPPGLIFPKEGSYNLEGDMKIIWETIPEAEEYSISLRDYSGVGFSVNDKTTDTSITFKEVPPYYHLRITLSSKKAGFKSRSISYQIFSLPKATDIEIFRHTNNKNLGIYPNPSKDYCFISFDSEISDKSKIEIYNITGTIVYSESLDIFTGRNNIPIDLRMFPPGFYTVHILIGKDFKYGVFIK